MNRSLTACVGVRGCRCGPRARPRCAGTVDGVRGGSRRANGRRARRGRDDGAAGHRGSRHAPDAGTTGAGDAARRGRPAWRGHRGAGPPGTVRGTAGRSGTAGTRGKRRGGHASAGGQARAAHGGLHHHRPVLAQHRHPDGRDRDLVDHAGRRHQRGDRLRPGRRTGPTMIAPVDLTQPSYRTLLLGMKAERALRLPHRRHRAARHRAPARTT